MFTLLGGQYSNKYKWEEYVMDSVLDDMKGTEQRWLSGVEVTQDVSRGSGGDGWCLKTGMERGQEGCEGREMLPHDSRWRGRDQKWRRRLSIPIVEKRRESRPRQHLLEWRLVINVVPSDWIILSFSLAALADNATIANVKVWPEEWITARDLIGKGISASVGVDSGLHWERIGRGGGRGHWSRDSGHNGEISKAGGEVVVWVLDA